MRLWLCVRLPFLPMQVFRPIGADSSERGFAVLDADKILLADRTARDAGIRRGMRKGGALTLLPDIELQPRQRAREQEALEALAMALLQYTPNVAIRSLDAASTGHAVVLEAAASLRLFGGIRALHRRIIETLEPFGYTAVVGMAPTALGAWLLSHTRHPRVLKQLSLANRLDGLDIALLPSTHRHLDWFRGLGCDTIGQLRRLPRAGLKRRCGEGLLDELDQALGEAPELLEWFEAPPVFDVRIELMERIEHAEAVLFSARRLMSQMTGWLTATHSAITRYVLHLEHERGRQAIDPTQLEVALGAPASQEAHLVRLLRERLARMELDAPVIAVRLEARDVCPMEQASEDLFPEPGGTQEDHSRLLELLAARLGADNVLRAAPQPDYRPEVANRWVPAGSKEKSVRPPGGLPRPGWLLETPLQLTMRQNRPFYGSGLRTVSPCERIECGWHDGQTVTRDYFVAQDEALVFYWIFKERIGSKESEQKARWFLHGLFA